MKILKRGIIPSEKKYIGNCHNCETKFQFRAKEAKLQVDQRDGNYYEVKCPVCKERVTVNV